MPQHDTTTPGPTKLFDTRPKGWRRLRPWVLICLLVLTMAAALATAPTRGGNWFFDIARMQNGTWAVIDKDDRRTSRARVYVQIHGEGSLYTEWKIQSLDAFNFPGIRNLPLPAVTRDEMRTLGLRALDRVELVNGRLEGTSSTSDYAATLKALRVMLSTSRDRYVTSRLGWAVETSLYMLVWPALAGLVLCVVIALARGSQRSPLRRKLEKIEQQMCPVCGYDLRGMRERVVCSECGYDIGRAEDECRAGLGLESRSSKPEPS